MVIDQRMEYANAVHTSALDWLRTEISSGARVVYAICAQYEEDKQ
jgi:hypothetical protein